MSDRELAVFYMRALRGVQSLSGAGIGHPGTLLTAINKYVTDILAESPESAVAKVVADLEALDSARGWAETMVESLQTLIRTKTEATAPQGCDNAAPCGDHNIGVSDADKACTEDSPGARAGRDSSQP